MFAEASALRSRYSPVPPLLTATVLPIRSWSDVIGEPAGTRMPSPMRSGSCSAKSLNAGVAARAVTAEVIEPCAKSSSLADISSAAGASGPAVPVHSTLPPAAGTDGPGVRAHAPFPPAAASAAARLPSFLPTASTPELPGSGMRTGTSAWLTLLVLALLELLLADELQPATAVIVITAANAAADAATPRLVDGRVICGRTGA